jgi:hypothetical protein
MKYNERQLISEFSKFIRLNPDKFYRSTCAIEFKIVKHPKKTLNLVFDFQPQQLQCLLLAQHSCLKHKISDMSMGAKPFDFFQICGAPSYVAVLFYKPKCPKIIYFININTILALKLNDNLLNEQTAGKFADLTICLTQKY